MQRHVALLPDENGTSLLQRLARESFSTGIPGMDTVVRLRPGVCIELAGPTGCAKTEVLIKVSIILGGLGHPEAVWPLNEYEPVRCPAAGGGNLP